MPYSVTPGNVARAEDVNQYKEALEGAEAVQYTLIQAPGDNFKIRLSTANGGDTVRIENVAGAAVIEMDSLGTIIIHGDIVVDGAVYMHNLPATDPTEDGRVWLDTGVLTMSAGS